MIANVIIMLSNNYCSFVESFASLRMYISIDGRITTLRSLLSDWAKRLVEFRRAEATSRPRQLGNCCWTTMLGEMLIALQDCTNHGCPNISSSPILCYMYLTCDGVILSQTTQMILYWSCIILYPRGLLKGVV